MKEKVGSNDQEHRVRAAALQEKSGGPEMVPSGPGALQRERIDNSPFVVAQKKKMSGVKGDAVQRQPLEDEELMQGKFAVQRQPLEDEELMQGKFAVQRQPLEDEELMQGKFAVQRVENKTGMPDEVKARTESAFNTDFSHVRVHPNSGKAPEVGALAYTQGSDIHFAPGQFKPESASGRQLLGHELAHVVQQSQGRVQPTGEVAGLPVNDSPSLEKEADLMGGKI